jgi:hypothetical protein
MARGEFSHLQGGKAMFGGYARSRSPPGQIGLIIWCVVIFTIAQALGCDFSKQALTSNPSANARPMN